MKNTKAIALHLLASLAMCTSVIAGESINTARLNTNTTIEVKEDWLTVTLQSRKDANTAAEVQSKLKKELTEALKVANSNTSSKNMEASTGSFQVFPRTNRTGTIIGWSGTAEMTLQGRDSEKIAATVGLLNQLAIINTQWSVSRELQEETEAKAQDQSIQSFRKKASEVAKSFGFSTYRIKEVSINSANPIGRVPMMAMAMGKSLQTEADTPMPTQAGNNTVAITISGTIEMH